MCVTKRLFKMKCSVSLSELKMKRKNRHVQKEYYFITSQYYKMFRNWKVMLVEHGIELVFKNTSLWVGSFFCYLVSPYTIALLFLFKNFLCRDIVTQRGRCKGESSPLPHNCTGRMYLLPWMFITCFIFWRRFLLLF